MKDNLTIRETTPTDVARILALYPQAFPDEELRPVVSALLAEDSEILSLATFDGDTLVAHVIFTLCGSGEGDRHAALLAPLCVIPAMHRQGLGTELVQAGLKQLGETGVRQVFVLGDPAYYCRFGFLPERQAMPPCPIPDEWAEAWQSLRLANRAPLNAGQLFLPKPWLDPALWAP